MEIFDVALNKQNLYESLFFNVKSATEYESVFDLKKENETLFNQWELMCVTKYGHMTLGKEDEQMVALNDLYQQKAIYYPEFCKIVAISHATITTENGQPKRNLFKIVDDDEFTIIKKFRDLLLQISKDGVQSTPNYFPTLCGHNVINNDIPLLIKRMIHYRDKFEKTENVLPYILKNYLKAKPWDSNVVDTQNIWKFNGIGTYTISMIGDFLGLKRNVEIMNSAELSKYYWENKKNEENDPLERIGLQSINETNLIIQMFSEFRYL